MNKLVPILGIIGAGGTIGLGIALFNVLSNKESIKDKLSKEGFKLLEDNRTEWKAIFESYKNVKNTWKFKKEHSGIADDIKNEIDLKKVCKSIVELKSSISEVYKSATKWCVVPRKVEEFVTGLLGVKDTDNSDEVEWKHNVDGYRATKKTNENKYEWSDVTFTNSEDTKKLKTGCKNRREKLTYDIEFDTTIEEVNKWCLIKKSLVE